MNPEQIEQAIREYDPSVNYLEILEILLSNSLNPQFRDNQSTNRVFSPEGMAPFSAFSSGSFREDLK